MKDVIFFDINTQYDFMHKDGKLYVPEAEKIIPNLQKITLFANKSKVSIVATIDLQKTKLEIPPNFMANGYKKIPETKLPNNKAIPNKKLNNEQLKNLLEKYDIFRIFKQKLDVFSNPNTKKLLNNVKRAYVYGVATDYCVKAAVLGLREMGVETYVIKDAIKPVFKKNEKKYLSLFRKKGAKFLTTSELLKKKNL